MCNLPRIGNKAWKMGLLMHHDCQFSTRFAGRKSLRFQQSFIYAQAFENLNS